VQILKKVTNLAFAPIHRDGSGRHLPGSGQIKTLLTMGLATAALLQMLNSPSIKLKAHR
jgi:hypothetical protein